MKAWVILALLLLSACTSPGVEHKVTLDVQQPIIAGQLTLLTVSLTNQDGEPLPLEIAHERIIHLVIIGEDFNSFAHIHSEDIVDIEQVRDAGKYPFIYAFPKAGTYLLAADYQVGGERYFGKLRADVQGTPEMQPQEPSYAREQNVDGYDAELNGPDKIEAGEPTLLTYTISKDGKMIEDLQPYLGAAMHIAIASEDLQQFQHVHGMAMPTGEHAEHEIGMLPAAFGPDVNAMVTFPVAGTYYLFGEFQHANEVRTSKFTVNVE
ncbi:MAG TPA: hypothetical protein VJJ75_01340 [Candidatus Nanoarchaeia archaeon]|nr:hypothetical protein [Candidatus Nanoarchaeia archaeon]